LSVKEGREIVITRLVSHGEFARRDKGELGHFDREGDDGSHLLFTSGLRL
jgi:hypothetical protein